uniref:Uncharacterized protein n=1 Tax=Lepeophtheirus salmonis TaxID=72036 RepID=A0A0K2TGH1_LEPSM
MLQIFLIFSIFCALSLFISMTNKSLKRSTFIIRRTKIFVFRLAFPSVTLEKL